MVQGQVLIRKHGSSRVRAGHLWVYRSDILDDGGAEPGSVVVVRDDRGIVGTAFYSTRSQIALRFLSRAEAVVDESFLRARLQQADDLRTRLGVDPRLSRRVYSEADLLPGFVVDRYGDYLVVQCLTQASDRLQPILTRLLEERYRPRTILLRNDTKVRELEGLPLHREWIGDAPPPFAIVEEDGRQVEIPLESGQKTGGYLDQRENHRAAGRYGKGRALDGFSYGGGFSLYLAGVCDSVEAVDLSRPAIELAQRNIERNGIKNVRCIEENVFDFLRRQLHEGEKYDTIVLDPPAFARDKQSLEGALRGYKEINLRAMRLLRPGGVLITCSCSHHVSEAIFAGMLAESARDAGCWVRVVERRIQAADHPVLLAVPETLYLKCFILEVTY